MKISVKMNGSFRNFNFDAYSDLIYSKLVFTKVMSNRDKNTGELFPIPFEKERIDFINSIFSKDKQKFIQLDMRDVNGVKYFIVNEKKRFDLRWLYQKHQINKVVPKVGTQKKSGVNADTKDAKKKAKKEAKRLLSKANKTKLKQILKDPQTIKWYMMSKEARVQLSGGSTSKKKKKVISKKSEKEFKSEDAMDYRVPGSFGTGKRR